MALIGVRRALIRPKHTVLAGAPTWTATANPGWQGNGSNSGNTSLTFSGVSIGSPAAADVIVIGVSTIAVGAITSVALNGVNATQQVATSSGSRQIAIYSITASAAGVTGSATSNIVVSTSANALGDAIVFVGKLTGVNSTPGTSDFKDMQTITAPATENVTVTVPSGGFGIFLGVDGTTETYTITNLTIDFSATNGSANGGIAKFGRNSTAGSQTVTSQGSGGGYILGECFTPWGP